MTTMRVRLDLRQAQTLVMTPQLQQAIKLLQMSNLEVTSFVERELEENPFLERAEDGDGEGATGPDAESSGGAVAEPGDAEPAAASAGDETFDIDPEWDDGADDCFAGLGSRGRSDPFSEAEPLEAGAAPPPTLREHLLAQLQVDVSDPGDRLIGVHLIDMVDDNGYLRGDLAAVAERVGCAPSRVERVLALLQQFDPAGVCARSLAECLAVQLRERNRLDPAMEALLANLDLLGQHQLQRLRLACQVSAEDLADMVAELRALDPRPGLAFSREATVQTVVPDIFLRALPNGEWLVELNAATLPRLLVNRRYYAKVSAAARGGGERGYFADRFQSANWLVKALDQRAQTVLRVAREIVHHQEAFFVHGVQHLRPLVLRDIAEAAGLHESTVSRVTSNKYMATPRGTFELKYFFTTAVGAGDGTAGHSAEAIRQSIKALIDRESPGDVLSDDRIVEILKAEGVAVARRTVAKYREALGIASSVRRRRQKALSLL
jgi:RNA polymerase sigma-54 factor